MSECFECVTCGLSCDFISDFENIEKRLHRFDVSND